MWGFWWIGSSTREKAAAAKMLTHKQNTKHSDRRKWCFFWSVLNQLVALMYSLQDRHWQPGKHQKNGQNGKAGWKTSPMRKDLKCLVNLAWIVKENMIAVLKTWKVEMQKPKRK